MIGARGTFDTDRTLPRPSGHCRRLENSLEQASASLQAFVRVQYKSTEESQSHTRYSMLGPLSILDQRNDGGGD